MTKKRLNLTIDDDLYQVIQRLPRTVSISEVVSYVLRCFLESAKKGHVLDDNEIQKLLSSTPELQDFQERLIEHWGPAIWKAQDKVRAASDTVKKKVRAKGRK